MMANGTTAATTGKRKRGKHDGMFVGVGGGTGVMDAMSSKVVHEHPDDLMDKLRDLVEKLASHRQDFKSRGDALPAIFHKTVDNEVATIIETCEEVLNTTSNAAGDFLHDLHVIEPEMGDVQKVVAAYPQSLLFKDVDGNLPIQNASASREGIKYIPLLAKEAIERGSINVGDDRGGLFLPTGEMQASGGSSSDSDADCGGNNSANVLQRMVWSSHDRAEELMSHDEQCALSLKELGVSNLLRHDDVKGHNLLHRCYNSNYTKRLEYLLLLDPSLISTPNSSGDVPMNIASSVIDDGIRVFATVLKVGMIHHPKQAGFLFHTNNYKQKALYMAVATFGKENVMKSIKETITEQTVTEMSLPILHKVFCHTPEFANEFVTMYPGLTQVQDKKGRFLSHIALQRGIKLSAENFNAVHCRHPQLLEKKDPLTGVYAFLLAAASRETRNGVGGKQHGEETDLNDVFKLLVSHPGVIGKVEVVSV